MKGKSGNPAGRPIKREEEFTPAALDQAWLEGFFMQVGGKSAITLIVQRTIVDALKGDAAARNLVFKMLDRVMKNLMQRDPILFASLSKAVLDAEIETAPGRRKELLRHANQLRRFTRKGLWLDRK